MEGNRTLLLALLGVFVLVLAYNVLYFTGLLGDSETQPVQQVQQPLIDIPGLSPSGASQEPSRPVPSGRRTGPQAQADAEEPRRAVPVATLEVGPDWGRNPFLTPAEIEALQQSWTLPVAEEVTPDINFTLTAIVAESTGRRVAVVNNEVVRTGDRVGGMEVAEILDDAVVLRGGGRESVIRLDNASFVLSSRRGSSSGGLPR